MDKKLSDDLDELRDAYKSMADYYEEDCDRAWNKLPQDEQLKMFYSVVKRIVQGELKDRGTYRWVLYNVFGFGPEAYGIGMECGYLDLHNAIESEPPKSTMYDPNHDGEL